MIELEIGQDAPSIDGIDQNGNNVSLDNYKGKKLILFFYPKDMTPGCTNAACSLRDHYSELKDNGFEMLGVSPDAKERHVRFIDKYQFPFDLLADTEKAVLLNYGVWGKKKFMGRTYDGVHRKTFIISEDSKIERIYNKVKTKVHAEQILEDYI